MANYSYISLPVPIERHAFLPSLAAAVCSVLGALWTIEIGEVIRGTLQAHVFLPGTAIAGPHVALRSERADDEDAGFLVELLPGGSLLTFRHPRNPFERWAQGCLEEELSALLEQPILLDATDRLIKPGQRTYSRHKTYYSYAARHLREPLGLEDRLRLAEDLQMAPLGHRS